MPITATSRPSAVRCPACDASLPWPAHVVEGASAHVPCPACGRTLRLVVVVERTYAAMTASDEGAAGQ